MKIKSLTLLLATSLFIMGLNIYAMAQGQINIKLSQHSNNILKDITGCDIIEDLTKSPLAITCSSHSIAKDDAVEWLVQYPGMDYTLFSQASVTTLLVYTEGRTNVKLRLNGNDTQTGETYVTVNGIEKTAISDIKADFKITYIANGNSYNVTNSLLPDFIGSLPYEVNLTNLTNSSSDYEWFVKTKGSEEYILVDTSPNPNIKINAYGPSFIKLRVNKNEALTKEYYVSSKEYGMSSYTDITNINESGSINKDVKINKTIVTTVETYVNSKEGIKPEQAIEIVKNLDDSVKPNFKILYGKDSNLYNVTNTFLPSSIKTLPYSVSLSNASTTLTDCVWYIKVPASNEYVWLDDAKNAYASIWHYGTTSFKLVLNGSPENSIEYTVTAYSPDSKKEKRVLAKEEIKADFKVSYSYRNQSYDVSNRMLPKNINILPYKVSLSDLSTGEDFSQWFIKQDGEEYKKIDNITNVLINNYGTTYIKLTLNGLEESSKVYSVTSYFDTVTVAQKNFGQQSQQNASPSSSVANFKLEYSDNDNLNDVTNKTITATLPYSLYCTNLANNDANKYEWFIKLPGTDYVFMSSLPSPTAIIHNFGTTYIKLRVNNNDSTAKEFSIRALSSNDIPKILSPLNNQKLSKSDLEISWNEAETLKSYFFSLYNESKKEYRISNQKMTANSINILSSFLEEGCKYRVRVTSVDPQAQFFPYDEISFFTSGNLKAAEKNKGLDDSIELSNSVDSNISINASLYNNFDKDYYKFEILENSLVTINLTMDKDVDFALDITDVNGKTLKRLAPDSNSIKYSNIYQQGTYFIKVYPNKSKVSRESYTLDITSVKYNPEVLLLYVGYGYQNILSMHYAPYTDADISKLLSPDKNIGTKEFLIVSGSQSGYGAHEAVIPGTETHVLNNLETDDTAKNSESMSSIKNEILMELSEKIDTNNDGILEANPNYIPLDRTLDSFSQESVDLALRLVNKDKNVKLWFSFPIMAHINLASNYTKPFKEKVLKNIKNKLDSVDKNIWIDNVLGFYYSDEDVPGWYTAFDTKNQNFLSTNPVVKSMAELSNEVHHKYKKMFLWIPYLGESPSNVTRLGYITNSTNIFDYVIVQPSRYFDGTAYTTEGTGDKEIIFSTSAPSPQKEITAAINCPGALSLHVELQNKNGKILSSKDIQGNIGFISIVPSKGMYSVVVTAINGNSKMYYNKAFYIDGIEHWNYNLDATLKTAVKNQVYYTGSKVKEGEIVTPKSSKTLIGFEMETDSYSTINPENISTINIFGSSAITDPIEKQRFLNMETEYEKFLKYSIKTKSAYYQEYLDKFAKVKKSFPTAFYAGERNELLESLNRGIVKASEGVYNQVKNFFGD